MECKKIHLLKGKSFLPLFLTQFFGAFNDNAFKLSMLTLISYHLSSSQSVSEFYQALAGALFILPFFIFSALAGQLADKFDKALLTRIVKSAELLLMILGSIALYKGSIFILMIVLTGMGLHSTFFGPIKYAILPDHLIRDDLLDATALIEASTFIAILLGTTFDTLSIGNSQHKVGAAAYLTIFAALLGLISSFFIPEAKSRANSGYIDWNLWRATKILLVSSLKDKSLSPAIITISWFWLIGAVMLTKLPDYTHYVLGADTTVFAVFLSLFSIGIAIGSIAISWFLKGNITLKYVPYAMFVLSFFAMDLYWASPVSAKDTPLLSLYSFLFNWNNFRIMLDFFLFSFCGGLFVVPLYTYIQVSSHEENRAKTIAANNIVNALSMVIGTLLVMILLKLNLGIPFVFLVLAVLNALAAGWLLFFTKTT